MNSVVFSGLKNKNVCLASHLLENFQTFVFCAFRLSCGESIPASIRRGKASVYKT